MFNTFKTLAVAATMAVAMPVASFAATLVNGTIDITGQASVDSLGATFDDGPFTGAVSGATGDFAHLTGLIADLTDIVFAAPGDIWEVGGFVFTATSFTGTPGTTGDFVALGTVAGNGFDATDGTLDFTSQVGSAATYSFSSTTTAVPVPAAGLLLLAGIGALGVAGRRKAA